MAAGPSPILAAVLAVSGASLFAVSAPRAAGQVAGRGQSGRGLLLASLAQVAAVLAVCGLASWPLTAVAWRLHDVTAILPGRLAGLLGLSASGSSWLTLWTGSQLEVVRLTFEGLGLYQVWFLLVTLVTVAWLSAPGPSWQLPCRAAVTTLAIVAAYTIFRFAALVVLAAEYAKPWLLWRQPYATISWLPLALLLRVPPPLYGSLWAAVRPWISPRAASLGNLVEPRHLNSLRHLARLSLLIAGLSLAYAAWFNDPGHAKRGRLLIDESHSNWEWAREPFDTTSFGIRAEYNYYCLREYLSHIYEVRISESTLTGALDSVDVLIVKTPTAAYAEPEIDAIEGFVRRGGGLLLIGDHTNLFGMSTYLNCIASRFGMRFRFDDTFDLETTGLSTYTRPRGSFHPAVRDLGRFGFLTSCSVDGGLGVEPVMVGYGLGSEDVDYGHPNFFGDIAYDLADRFGLFLQAGAKRYGAGRVLLFTDSTCFSNFCMFSPGKPEAVLGFIDYLNRRGTRYPHARLGALVLAGVLAGCAGLTGFAPRAPGNHARPEADDLAVGGTAKYAGQPFGLRAAGTLVLAGLALGAFATARLSALAYGPVRVPQLASVIFDTEHSGGSFFNYLGEFPERRWQQFAELYLAVQRLGLHPRAGTCADLQQLRPLAVVVVNPVLPFPRRETGELVQFVRGGGRLLLLDSVLNSASTANQALGAFGMRAVIAPAGSAQAVAPALRVSGATASRTMNHLGMEVFTKDFGKGRVVVGVDAFALSTAVLGPALERTRPSAWRLRAYNEVFDLLRSSLLD